SGRQRMRFITFEHAGTARVGLCEGEHAIDLSEAAPDLPRDLVGLIRAGASAFATAAQAVRTARPGTRHPPDRRGLLPAIPNPGKIICLGLNYADHAAEGGHAKPEYPSFFMRGATSLVAHGEKMIRPRFSEKLDFEAELVAVVGRTARHVKKADAYAYI